MSEVQKSLNIYFLIFNAEKFVKGERGCIFKFVVFTTR